jgi:hypothetical protein
MTRGLKSERQIKRLRLHLCKGISGVKRIGLSSFILLLLAISSAYGQVGLYGGFSAANTNAGSEQWFYGTTFGGYYSGLKLPLINLGIEGRASMLHGSGSASPQKFVNGLVGPRVQLHLPLVPLKPYVAGLAGGVHQELGQGSARTDTTNFGYGLAAGADLTIFPLLDWRIAEFSFTRSESVDQKMLTTGLVLRLPVP